jgi:hypothetical protein
MKKITYVLAVVLMAFATSVFAQVNLDELAAAISEDLENAEELVEAAVSENPAQVTQILAQLLVQFPALAEAITAGAISGMPEETSSAEIVNLVGFAVSVSPALASSILAGARGAAAGNVALISQMESAGRSALRGLRAIPGAVRGGPPAGGVNETVRISPSRNL